eukprot:Rhum_TRINITY_DN14631_c3_g2::Rhum_TRINITY_DN14631_c3_g2_i1::g.105002::m.105002/K00621/GNPNAT1, GNA1; glucosamine-phosphate N-acetyltransferase
MANNESVLAGRSFEGYTVRYLESQDYSKGFLSLLSELTVVGDVTQAMFDEAIARRAASSTVTVVIEDTAKAVVVATGSLLVEHKFIHACGSVGHIEDIVVRDGCRGKKLGQRVMECLQEEALRAGCYKVILDSDEKNEGFYIKAGFQRKEFQMRYNCAGTLEEFVEKSIFRSPAGAKAPSP